MKRSKTKVIVEIERTWPKVQGVAKYELDLKNTKVLSVYFCEPLSDEQLENFHQALQQLNGD